MSDNSEDDYELPSLSDRVQAFQKPKNVSDVYTTSDSESDEKEFLKFSEKIRNTPCSSIKSNLTISNICSSIETDKEQEDRRPVYNLEKKFEERIDGVEILGRHFSSGMQITSDSESDESDFQKFSERVRNTPRSDIKGNLGKDNANKQSIITAHSISELKPEINKKSLIKNNNNCSKASESDSDNSFFIPKKLPKTPKSLIRTGKKKDISPTVVKENTCSKEHNETHALQKPGYLSVVQMENEKEFRALFPPNTVDLCLMENQRLFSGRFYEFFNRKVFNSELPSDMRIVLDDTLIATAGMACASKKDDTYSCYIRLSTYLVNSLVRLHDTLLHEMCHAAVWLINHSNENHGPLWKTWASRCKLILPCIDIPERCHKYNIPYRVWYKCPSCKRKIGRCRQVKKFENYVCSKCNVPFIVETN